MQNATSTTGNTLVLNKIEDHPATDTKKAYKSLEFKKMSVQFNPFTQKYSPKISTAVSVRRNIFPAGEINGRPTKASPMWDEIESGDLTVKGLVDASIVQLDVKPYSIDGVEGTFNTVRAVQFDGETLERVAKVYGKELAVKAAQPMNIDADEMPADDTF